MSVIAPIINIFLLFHNLCASVDYLERLLVILK